MSSAPMLQQAQALLKIDRPKEAAKVLLRALSTDPDDAAARRLLGFAYLNQNDPRRALTEVERAIALEPEAAIGHDYRAWVLHALRREPDAVASALEAVRLAPEDPEGLRTLCTMQLAVGQVEQADATASRLSSIDPNNARTFDCLGRVRVDQNRPREAIEMYRKGLAIDPRDNQLINNLGIAVIKAKGLDAAITVLGQAVRAKPQDLTARSNLFLVTQARLYAGWVVLLALFGGQVITHAVIGHVVNWPDAAMGFFITTVMMLIWRTWQLMRMDPTNRAFIRAEVRRGRRALLPPLAVACGLVWLGLAILIFAARLELWPAIEYALAALGATLLLGAVLPWPPEYLPWRRN